MSTQRVLITAGATGIGLAIAEAFVDKGSAVHVCDISRDNLAACKAALPTVSTSLTDVADPKQVEQLFREAERSLGGLDVLVNNAGIAGPTARVEDVAPEEWDRTLAVCINSQFYCAHHAVPMLKQSGGGCIINISSTAGLMAYPLRAPYATAKWAVIGFTKTLAMELGADNIRANAICPGSVEGPRMDRVIAAEAIAQGVSEDTIRENYVGQSALRTFISGKDIANTALFLCSPAGNRISGQVLSVDGYTETTGS